jgi:hypothetical protein
MSSPPVFRGVRVIRSLVFWIVSCRYVFVLLSFFIWPLCCLSFFDLQILITLLVFSNSFYNQLQFITYNMVSSWHRAYRTFQDTIQKTKDRITRTPLKAGGELMCSRMVGSSYSTSDTCRFTLVKSPVLSHEWGMDREVHTTSDIQVFGDMMHIPFLCFGQLRKNCIQLLFSVYFYLKLIYANFEPEYMWLYRYVWQIYAIYLNQKFSES